MTPREEIASLLARLRAVEAAGTRGPWRLGDSIIPGLREIIATLGPRLGYSYKTATAHDGPDATLIATSRNALLPLVEAIEEAVNALEYECIDGHVSENCPCPAVERLLARLREIQ